MSTAAIGKIALNLPANREMSGLGMKIETTGPGRTPASLRRRLQLRPRPPQQREERGVERQPAGCLQALPPPVGLHILAAHQVSEAQLGAGCKHSGHNRGRGRAVRAAGRSLKSSWALAAARRAQGCRVKGHISWMQLPAGCSPLHDASIPARPATHTAGCKCSS